MYIVTRGKPWPLKSKAMLLTCVPCSSLIVSALERRFPPSAGYGTLFPCGKHGRNSDTGLMKAFSKYYADQLFNLGPLLLPWNKMNPDFIKDRSTVSQPRQPRSLLDRIQQTVL